MMNGNGLWGRIFGSSWFLPVSVLVLGGFWIGSIENSDDKMVKMERRIQQTRADLIHEDRLPIAEATDTIMVRYQQPSLPKLSRENLYPDGNPPYRNLTIAKSSQNRKSIKDKTEQVLAEDLTTELEALKKDKKQKLAVPESLKDPMKRQKALKMLADTYQIFNRDISVASKVVQEAMQNNTRTEDEINEALEAIDQMKKGRRMLIEKIEAIEDFSSDDAEDPDQFLLPDEEEDNR